MDWLYVLRAIGALMLTLALLALIAFLVRKYGLMGEIIPQKGNKRRLKLIEQLWLDAGRSRIIIIECDGIEQTILLSPNGATNLNLKTNPIGGEQNA